MFSFEGHRVVIVRPRYRQKGTGSQKKDKENKRLRKGKGWSKYVD